ncbi:hypothetical protein CYMTET_30635 [Cymbomonas tetramitiformis]|uniref:PDEase domain-containing protein n=1 Tax=Cymbomonas tetramitiformis TaxID=36881 RepID=A0AAE0KTY1_9CHLO|nr:hypothetical protein CYMTET_30635 [Cymbomonas tetramitiformis]
MISQSPTKTFPAYDYPAEPYEQWDFDVLQIPKEELSKVIINMFKHLNLLSAFNIAERTLYTFVEEIRLKYLLNPYHNFVHAVDVTQMMFVLLTHGNAKQFFTHLDTLILMTAAVCHDVEHPGVNQAFLAAIKDPRVAKYGNSSVLEKHHLGVTFALLADPRTDVFAGLSVAQAEEARKSLRNIVLATDMARHKEISETFQRRLDVPEPLSCNSEEDRVLLSQMIMKCADLGNVTRSWKVGSPWCTFLAEEFSRQGDQEEQHGLPVTPMMDRRLIDVRKQSAGFIGFMALPMFELAARWLPELGMHVVPAIRANVDLWKSMLPPPEDPAAGEGCLHGFEHSTPIDFV